VELFIFTKTVKSHFFHYASVVSRLFTFAGNYSIKVVRVFQNLVFLFSLILNSYLMFNGLIEMLIALANCIATVCSLVVHLTILCYSNQLHSIAKCDVASNSPVATLSSAGIDFVTLEISSECSSYHLIESFSGRNLQMGPFWRCLLAFEC